MTRIDQTFEKLKSEGKKAFVSYIMAGDPDFETSLELVMGLPAAGVDIIELGLPFTDPKIGRAHVRTPVTRGSRMPSSA